RFYESRSGAALSVAGKNERARDADRVDHRGTEGTHFVLDLVRPGSHVPAEPIRDGEAGSHPPVVLREKRIGAEPVASRVLEGRSGAVHFSQQETCERTYPGR